MSIQMDHTRFLRTLPAETRRRLTERSDAPGLVNLALHLGSILGLAVWILKGFPLWPLAIPVLGILLAFLFTLQHECTHRTPFHNRRLNDAVGYLAGLILIQPFLWFRDFHMEHHRFTNIPGRDPELAHPQPETKAQLVWHVSCIGYWIDKFGVLLKNAFGEGSADYVLDRNRSAVQREARVMLACYAGLLLLTPLIGFALFWVWLLPLAFGFPVLRLYLLAEHGRCPQVANMFENSRTTLTAALVNRVAWNMPYHAEHHAWPAVPFHRLPELHQMTKPHLGVVTDGYTSFMKDYLKHTERSI